jgi:hypothetical protein
MKYDAEQAKQRLLYIVVSGPVSTQYRMRLSGNYGRTCYEQIQ